MHFNFPWKTDKDMQEAIRVAVAVECELKGYTAIFGPDMIKYITASAKWLLTQKKWGFIMLGLPGNGKTTLLSALCRLINISKFKDHNGESLFIRKFAAPEIVKLQIEDKKHFDTICKCEMLAVDDLGTEPLGVRSYGNVLSPMADLLEYRYNKQLLTIISSNLQPSQIREIYGDRLADRFNEMFEICIFENPSFRK